MLKTNVCVTSEMVHKTHIKHIISVHMLNFQQKKFCDWFQMSQLGTFFLKIIFFGLATYWLGSTGRFQWGGILAPFWQRSRSMLGQSIPACMYMVLGHRYRLPCQNEHEKDRSSPKRYSMCKSTWWLSQVDHCWA